MAKEVVQERLLRARSHLEFCTKLYALQIHHGRYFLHEHPQSATSWREECVQKILGEEGVTYANADGCQYGLASQDGKGRGAARKAAGFMTNAPYVALQLKKRCPNRTGKNYHRHVILEGGRTKPAQVYPEGLCKAICIGLIQQISMDQKGQLMLAQLAGTEKEATDIRQQLQDDLKIVEYDNDGEMQQAWDDVSGAELNPGIVKTARGEEVAYIRTMNLYTKVPANECWQKIGKKANTSSLDRRK